MAKVDLENICFGWLGIYHMIMLDCAVHLCMNRSMLFLLACLMHRQALFKMNIIAASVLIASVSEVPTLGNAGVPPDYARSYPDSIKICFWVSPLVWPISVKFGDRTVEELGQSSCNYWSKFTCLLGYMWGGEDTVQDCSHTAPN